jgi:hypothetical protein
LILRSFGLFGNLIVANSVARANNTPFLSLLALFLVDPRQEPEWDGWYVFGVDEVINEIETGS